MPAGHHRALQRGGVGPGDPVAAGPQALGHLRAGSVQAGGAGEGGASFHHGLQGLRLDPAQGVGLGHHLLLQYIPLALAGTGHKGQQASGPTKLPTVEDELRRLARATAKRHHRPRQPAQAGGVHRGDGLVANAMRLQQPGRRRHRVVLQQPDCVPAGAGQDDRVEGITIDLPAAGGLGQQGHPVAQAQHRAARSQPAPGRLGQQLAQGRLGQ